jgi:hypothetical protein
MKDPFSSGHVQVPDLRFPNRSAQIHTAIQALHEFHEEKKCYPDASDDAEVA